jgi:murein DD-endopeptidase MepM/ murein hydrolase activator NlpD
MFYVLSWKTNIREQIMTGFRGIRFVTDLWKKFRANRESLTNNELDQQETIAAKTLSILKNHKWPLLYGFSAVALMGAITIAGNQYVAKNMVAVYHVTVDGEEIGIVSDDKMIEQYKISRKQEVQQQFPNVRMVVRTEAIETSKPEKVYKMKTDDQGVIAELNEKLAPQPVGTELKVDGNLIAIVKDQITANQILDKIKEPYAAKPKESGKVGTLSLGGVDDLNSAPSEVQKVDFVQQVQIDEIPIKPEDLANPDDVVKKLQTGGMQPTKYKVVEGDCVSCIAKKFNTTKQFIYDKNPWIKDDKLKIGAELDLTVLKPTLSVKTIETVVQNHEVQYDTEYVKDDSLRAGVIQSISPGKNGLKKVTIEVTKVDGQLQEETVLNEEVIEQPVTAKAKKGTKVVLGEGSGKFAWPVVSPNITSTFGMRWGKLHKGIDITGNKSILSADNGKVIETGYKDDYGNYIIINHLNGYETLYGHLSKIDTSAGKIVEKGEKIGIMGSTGDSTGVHLHFEIHKSGSLENPLKYLNR